MGYDWVMPLFNSTFRIECAPLVDRLENPRQLDWKTSILQLGPLTSNSVQHSRVISSFSDRQSYPNDVPKTQK